MEKALQLRQVKENKHSWSISSPSFLPKHLRSRPPYRGSERRGVETRARAQQGAELGGGVSEQRERRETDTRFEVDVLNWLESLIAEK